MYPEIFNYYHLYSIPILSQSQFKTIIPINKYLLKSDLYYTFQSDICTKIVPKFYVCKKLNLQEANENNPCEIQLLDMKNTSTCQQTKVKITKPLITQLESTQWIGIFPNKESINLKCQQQEEILKLTGTYLISIPTGCQVVTAQKKIITNEEQTINANQIIFFPELDRKSEPTLKQDWSFELENVKLDELQDIKKQIIENRPQIFQNTVSHLPSTWTITLYILIILTVLYFCYKKLSPRCQKKEETNQENQHQPRVELTNVQLPR